MLNPVSNLSFRGEVPASDWQKLIESEGQYTQKPSEPAKPDTFETSKQPENTEKKGSKAGKIIGGTIAGIIVAGLALYGLYKGNILKKDNNAKGFAKVVDWLAQAGDWIGTKLIDPLLGLFKGKKGADAAKKTADAAQNTAS